jgi:hypothetical protein
MRLSKRLARKRTASGALPPVSTLLRQAKVLRERFPDDRKVTAICDAFETVTKEMLDAGYVLRSGGGEATKPVPLHETMRPYAAQWEKPPPEKPGE